MQHDNLKLDFPPDSIFEYFIFKRHLNRVFVCTLRCDVICFIQNSWIQKYRCLIFSIIDIKRYTVLRLFGFREYAQIYLDYSNILKSWKPIEKLLIAIFCCHLAFIWHPAEAFCLKIISARRTQLFLSERVSFLTWQIVGWIGRTAAEICENES